MSGSVNFHMFSDVIRLHKESTLMRKRSSGGIASRPFLVGSIARGTDNISASLLVGPTR